VTALLKPVTLVQSPQLFEPSKTAPKAVFSFTEQEITRTEMDLKKIVKENDDNLSGYKKRRHTIIEAFF
jgi:hypothetical protein